MNLFIFPHVSVYVARKFQGLGEMQVLMNLHAATVYHKSHTLLQQHVISPSC